MPLEHRIVLLIQDPYGPDHPIVLKALVRLTADAGDGIPRASVIRMVDAQTNKPLPQNMTLPPIEIINEAVQLELWCLENPRVFTEGRVAGHRY